MKLDSTSSTFGKLMGSGVLYEVPRFQRDYSWTITEWDELWFDISDLVSEKGELQHYLGYIVLQGDELRSRKFSIIDGQQRITTLSILVLAVLGNLNELIESNIDAENNKLRLKEFRKTFIGQLDTISMVTHSKLTLNKNNNETYQLYLVPLKSAPKQGLKKSDKSMKKAYDWFFLQIKTYIKSKENKGEALAKFIEKISAGLVFTVVNISSELNAYRVFETLNARGVKLSSTDLLKNYLFSIVHKGGGSESDMEMIEKRWERITGVIGDDDMTDFLRYYWNSTMEFSRHSELFKNISRKISSREQVFELLLALDNGASVFSALPKHYHDLWSDEQRIYIELLNLFGVRQQYPLLLAAYEKFNSADFTTILKTCAIISFRYNVIGNRQANEQEKVYTTTAIDISCGKHGNVNQVLEMLRPIYITDEKFKSDFAGKDLRTVQTRNSKIVRYILFALEGKEGKRELDINSKSFDIEHIMPESPAVGWEHISGLDQEQFLYRLGNMTIIEKTKNKELGNKAYSIKNPVYSTSEVKITSKIAAEFDRWTPSEIHRRQAWMAKQATAIWRISQFD